MHRRKLLAIGIGSVLMPRLAVAQDATAGIEDLYTLDLSVSDYAQSLAGAPIRVPGYMAPPLMAESRFFVLTNRPMPACPFCSPDLVWPTDTVAVYTRRIVRPGPFHIPVLASGRLDLGPYTDPDFGLVSTVRLMDATYEAV